MDRDFSEIKRNAEELTANLNELREEAVSFSDAKATLVEASKAITKATDHLTDLTENSSKMLDEVESVSTKHTLEVMTAAAQDIKTACEKIIESNQQAVQEIGKQSKIMGVIAIACAVAAVVIAIVL